MGKVVEEGGATPGHNLQSARPEGSASFAWWVTHEARWLLFPP